ncbi:MAG: permease-like cell division protein FtsX [Bacteroidetes bacterium]|nr:permease-like cell division protein FtsX [Bacteroidota bacterium]
MSANMFNRKRPSGSEITTAVTTTIGMTLTLLLIGILLTIGYLGFHWGQELRQEARVQVFFQREANPEVLAEAREILRTDPAVESSNYIDAETASRELEAELGESFVDFLGYVPLADVMDLRMLPEASTSDELRVAVERMENIAGVSEVVWQAELLEQIESTIQRLVWPLAGLALVFLFAALALMNNTIRLTVFGRRFLIKTMQLVGAHPRSIRAPFIRQGLYYGVISGALAFAAINSVLAIVQVENAAILDDFTPTILATLFGVLISLGVLFGVSSTAFAVNRFLKRRLDTLH